MGKKTFGFKMLSNTVAMLNAKLMADEITGNADAKELAKALRNLSKEFNTKVNGGIKTNRAQTKAERAEWKRADAIESATRAGIAKDAEFKALIKADDIKGAWVLIKAARQAHRDEVKAAKEAAAALKKSGKKVAKKTGKAKEKVNAILIKNKAKTKSVLADPINYPPSALVDAQMGGLSDLVSDEELATAAAAEGITLPEELAG